MRSGAPAVGVPANRPPARRLTRAAPRPVLLAASVVAVAIALVPLVYLFVRTAEAGTARIAEQVFTSRVLELSLRSVAMAAVVTVACLVVGVAQAFAVVRSDLPGRRTIAVLAMLPLAVPTYVAGFAWVSTFPNFEGFWAATLLLTLACSPYVFLPVAAALRGADHAQEEVAASLGHSPWRTFVGVTLRQIRPAMTGGGLLVALYVLSDFGAVATVRADTFTRAIFVSLEMGFDRTGALVLACVLVMLTLALLALESSTRRRGMRHAPVGGTPRLPARAHLGATRPVAMVGLAAVSVVALGVPAWGITTRLLQGVSRPGGLDEVGAAALSSVGLALLGMIATMVLALPIGLLAARAPGLPARVLEGLSYVTHALPGVVVGLSVVFLGITVLYPLYQSVWLLALAYVALFLPLGVAGVAGAAAACPPVLEDVARSLGRGSWTVFRTVTLPLTLPGIGAGAALVFLTVMKELPATLLLRPTGLDTLATDLWRHTAVGSYAAAAPYAALIVLLSSVPTWFIAARSGLLSREVAP